MKWVNNVRPKIKRIIMCFAVAVLFCSIFTACSTMPRGRLPSEVYGFVRNCPCDELMANIEIIFSTDTQTKPPVQTDNFGGYSIVLSSDPWLISISVPGYKPYSEIFDVPSNQVVRKDICLKVSNSGDLDCDGDVDGSDLEKFATEYGGGTQE